MWGRGQRNKVMKYREGPRRVICPWAPNVLATPLIHPQRSATLIAWWTFCNIYLFIYSFFILDNVGSRLGIPMIWTDRKMSITVHTHSTIPHGNHIWLISCWVKWTLPCCRFNCVFATSSVVVVCTSPLVLPNWLTHKAPLMCLTLKELPADFLANQCFCKNHGIREKDWWIFRRVVLIGYSKQCRPTL